MAQLPPPVPRPPALLRTLPALQQVPVVLRGALLRGELVLVLVLVLLLPAPVLAPARVLELALLVLLMTTGRRVMLAVASRP